MHCIGDALVTDARAARSAVALTEVSSRIKLVKISSRSNVSFVSSIVVLSGPYSGGIFTNANKVTSSTIEIFSSLLKAVFSFR
jgi:hypothetical protein